MELHDAISSHFRLAKNQQNALKRLGILTIEDLLFHFPARYERIDDVRPIAGLKKDDTTILYGKITKLKSRRAWRRKIPIAEGFLEDGTGKIKVIWFNQPYIAKMIPEGSYVKLAGKVTGTVESPYIANPEVEVVGEIPVEANTPLFQKEGDTSESALYAVYPETFGVTSKWIRYALEKVFKSGILEKIVEPLPKEIYEKYHLPEITTGLIWIHTPKNEKDALSARKRFAFQEIFFIQLSRIRERKKNAEQPSFIIHVDREAINEFVKRFPFEATEAQKRAIETILSNFEKKQAMGRLLEGDVGSGKTAVAASTVYAVATTRPEGKDYGNLQTAYMVPTEILARQHFESFIKYFSHMRLNIGLITSSGARKFPSKVNPNSWTDISRSQLLKWVANGEIPILIGTHALIQKTVQFKNLAYVIIDEQHRFGTSQRQKLTRKDNIVPHLLSMTATPIPRTLALTIYGDLDLTLLDEMPKGRKPIITEIVTPGDRTQTYEKIRTELNAGRQAYVICPRIDEPDPSKELALQAKSVKEEAKRLKSSVFPEFDIAILHSKMTPKEKDDTMQKFLQNKIQILVATSVVEVGVNVPNATIIVIEGAERFGLAQLHQLRGRVIRSTHQAYCYVFADSKGKMTLDRLRALKTAKNGFELAEKDLEIRGPGELYGRNQSGLSDIGMEALKNIKMVEAARTDAENMIEKDPELTSYPDLRDIVLRKSKKIHFE